MSTDELDELEVVDYLTKVRKFQLITTGAGV